MASTTYVVKQFQSSKDLEKFLNTGNSTTANTPVVQTCIVSCNFDAGNGRYYLVLAPGY